MKIAVIQKIVNRIDGAAGGVVDGKKTIFAKTIFHRLADTGKVVKVHNVGDIKKFISGDLTVSTFSAHAGDDGTFRELFRGIGNDFCQLFTHTAGFPVEFPLIGTGEFHQIGKELDGIFAQIIAAAAEDLEQNLPFPFAVQNRSVAGFFQPGDLGGNSHTLLKKLQNLIIKFIDPAAALFNTHFVISSKNYLYSAARAWNLCNPVISLSKFSIVSDWAPSHNARGGSL